MHPTTNPKHWVFKKNGQFGESKCHLWAENLSTFDFRSPMAIWILSKNEKSQACFYGQLFCLCWFYFAQTRKEESRRNVLWLYSNVLCVRSNVE